MGNATTTEIKEEIILCATNIVLVCYLLTTNLPPFKLSLGARNLESGDQLESRSNKENAHAHRVNETLYPPIQWEGIPTYTYLYHSTEC